MKKLITYTPYVKSYEVSTIKTIQKRTLRKIGNLFMQI